MNGEKHIEELKRFGQHLKKLREEQFITQEMLANDSDISISQISRIERGIISTSLSQLISISKSLNISLSDLMDF